MKDDQTPLTVAQEQLAHRLKKPLEQVLYLWNEVQVLRVE
jgi:hypothetical protein